MLDYKFLVFQQCWISPSYRCCALLESLLFVLHIIHVFLILSNVDYTPYFFQGIYFILGPWWSDQFLLYLWNCILQKMASFSFLKVFLVANSFMLVLPLNALAETCEPENSFLSMPLLFIIALIGATVGGNGSFILLLEYVCDVCDQSYIFAFTNNTFCLLWSNIRYVRLQSYISVLIVQPSKKARLLSMDLLFNDCFLTVCCIPMSTCFVSIMTTLAFSFWWNEVRRMDLSRLLYGQQNATYATFNSYQFLSYANWMVWFVGLLARQRRGELERLNDQLRQINAALRRQAKIESYAPNLSYAPVGRVSETEVIIDPRKQQLITNLRTGKNYLRNQDPEKALAEFNEAFELAETLGDHVEEKKAARGLGSAFPFSIILMNINERIIASKFDNCIVD